jgi:hypothetical protein
MTVTVGGEPTLVRVPVEMPDGVSYEGVFGQVAGHPVAAASASPAKTRLYAMAKPARSSGHSSQSGFQSVQSPLGRGVVKEAFADVDAVEERAGDRKIERAASKIDPRLRNVMGAAARSDFNGNATVDKLRIVDFKIDVRVYLSDTSKETMKKLAGLGFILHVESKTVRMVIGAIDVRMLKKLADLDAVVAIAPALEG